MRRMALKSISVALDGRVCYITVSFLGSTEGKTSSSPTHSSPLRLLLSEEKSLRIERASGRESEAPQERSPPPGDVLVGYPESDSHLPTETHCIRFLKFMFHVSHLHEVAHVPHYSIHST